MYLNGDLSSLALAKKGMKVSDYITNYLSSPGIVNTKIIVNKTLIPTINEVWVALRYLNIKTNNDQSI